MIGFWFQIVFKIKLSHNLQRSFQASEYVIRPYGPVLNVFELEFVLWYCLVEDRQL